MADESIDARQAQNDLDYLAQVLERSRSRVDPHLFHFVHWGALVLLWYPCANYLSRAGQQDAADLVGLVAITCGALLSGLREARMRRRGDRQSRDPKGLEVLQIVCFSLAGSFAWSMLARDHSPPGLAITTGLAYANLCVMTGIVYHRDFRYAGLLIFGACLLAHGLPEYWGYILGPAMGLGILVPGLRAEARVRAR